MRAILILCSFTFCKYATIGYPWMFSIDWELYDSVQISGESQTKNLLNRQHPLTPPLYSSCCFIALYCCIAIDLYQPVFFNISSSQILYLFFILLLVGRRSSIRYRWCDGEHTIRNGGMNKLFIQSYQPLVPSLNLLESFHITWYWNVYYLDPSIGSLNFFQMTIGVLFLVGEQKAQRRIHEGGEIQLSKNLMLGYELLLSLNPLLKGFD